MMTFQKWETTVTEMLTAQPAYTGLKIGGGYQILHDGMLCALACTDSSDWNIDDTVIPDASAWDCLAEAFDGMTKAQMQDALRHPVYKQFNRPTDEEDFSAAPARLNNQQFVVEMMSFSKAGGLKEAFVIEAIHKYAKLTLADKGDNWPEAFLSRAAWVQCAQECIDSITARNAS